MTYADLRIRIIERHNEVMRKAFELFPAFRNAPECRVYFFETGKAAGLAHGDMRVGYNLHIFAQDAERFLADTVPHEVAHIVCFALGLDRGHGAKWKRVCRLLGGNAQRCFSGDNIETKMLRHRKKYEYRAECGTAVNVTDVMHGKIQKGRVYVLKATRGKIMASGFTGKAI